MSRGGEKEIKSVGTLKKESRGNIPSTATACILKTKGNQRSIHPFIYLSKAVIHVERERERESIISLSYALTAEEIEVCADMVLALTQTEQERRCKQDDSNDNETTSSFDLCTKGIAHI